MSRDILRRLPYGLARTGAILCGWWLAIFSLLTCVEIVGRKLFGFTLHGIDEIGGYPLAITCAVGFSYALVQRSHTRVDILLTRLPPHVAAVLNAGSMVVLSIVVVFTTWRGFVELRESIEFMSVANSPLQTPMWLPQGFWFVGLVLFAAIATIFAIDGMRLLLVDWRRVNQRYGPPSLDEEITAELRAASKHGDRRP